jgi:multidrug efflux pump subunit AcrA (membrane-fusion protein)
MTRVSKRNLVIAGVGVLCLVVLGVIVAARPNHVSGAQPGGEWIGTLDGLVNADVRAQVTGYLQRQGYQEGAFVNKGQLLFQIDPRPFQAALDQAEGQLAQAKAALANAIAVQGRQVVLHGVVEILLAGGPGHGGNRQGANQDV